MKLTKKEREKLKKQMNKPKDRGETWIGYKPSIFKDKTKDNKTIRTNNKKICKEANKNEMD